MNLPPNLSSTVWISLAAYSMIQGYVLFLLFPTYKAGSKQAKWILSVLSLCCALVLTGEFIESTIGYGDMPHLIYVFSPVWYLLAPLIFIYIRLYTKRRLVGWKDLIHLIPAIWVIWNTMDFYQAPGAYKLSYLESLATGEASRTHSTNFMVFCIQSGYYLMGSWLLLKSELKANKKKAHHRWLWQLFIGLVVITGLGLATFISLRTGRVVVVGVNASYIILVSLFLLKLFLKSIRSPKELYFIGRPPRLKPAPLEKNTYGIFETIDQYLKEEHPYRDPHYDIHSLATHLSYSKSFVNGVIREHSGQSFRDFINQYRIEEAKRKLNSPLSKQYTIQSIASDSGFNSLATFYRVFKRVEGVTPKAFIQE